MQLPSIEREILSDVRKKVSLVNRNGYQISNNGIFFFDRRVVRPGLYFRKTAKEENIAGFRKKYRSSDSHSPGICTGQCCCKFPKILGISVM